MGMLAAARLVVALLLAPLCAEADFRPLGAGYCRGPGMKGVMGRDTTMFLGRSACAETCAGFGAACVGYSWGRCFAVDPSCNQSDHLCALYGQPMSQGQMPANWTQIPEYIHYHNHSVLAHPASTITQVQNEHDGTSCYVNCVSTCPPPPSPSPPGDSLAGSGTSATTVVLAILAGVVLTVAAVGVANKLRVVEVRWIDAPLIQGGPSDSQSVPTANAVPASMRSERESLDQGC